LIDLYAGHYNQTNKINGHCCIRVTALSKAIARHKEVFRSLQILQKEMKREE